MVIEETHLAFWDSHQMVEGFAVLQNECIVNQWYGFKRHHLERAATVIEQILRNRGTLSFLMEQRRNLENLRDLLNDDMRHIDSIYSMAKSPNLTIEGVRNGNHTHRQIMIEGK
jgi:hypothetical protein